MNKIYGVNLGNWLVLEKWMHPDLFAGVNAEDETDLCEMLPPDVLKDRLTKHRDSYITLEDFKYIKGLGLNSIRIPVPHFIFGDAPPYVGCVDWLDKAFDWAEQTGLSILIDLHTVPDSQNGFDNGGICGVCKWHQKQENIDRTLDILDELARRYKNRKALWGIQLLNEPVSEELWMFIRERYKPRDPERAKGSTHVPMDVLLPFYAKGYERLRGILEPHQQVVVHDGFRLPVMLGFLKENKLPGLVLDTHIYVGMTPSLSHADMSANMDYILKNLAANIKEAQAICPVIVGEWCIAHHDRERDEKSELDKKLAYRLIADAQLTAWEKGSGFYFWSYKLPSDPPGWDLRRCVERDWITGSFTK